MLSKMFFIRIYMLIRPHGYRQCVLERHNESDWSGWFLLMHALKFIGLI